jgi:hypothetical protein
VDEKRLLAYAAAAGAVLAAAGPADASIVYSGIQNLEVRNNSVPAYITGGNAITFTHKSTQTISFSNRGAYVTGNLANNLALAMTTSGSLARLPQNAPINANISVWNNGRALLFSKYLTRTSYGPFAYGRTGYIGFRFSAGGGNYNYGWIQINPNITTSYTIKDWAYQDAVDKSINAGQIVDDPAAVPEPSTLALLALGAGGLAIMRRRKKPEQVQ